MPRRTGSFMMGAKLEHRMSLIEWPGNLATGHALIDDQHGYLIGIVDRLASAAERGDGEDSVRQVLCDLLDYASAHFSHEEALMDRSRHPDADGHWIAHSALLDAVSRLVLDFETGRPNSTEPMALLQRWLSDHIGRLDKALAGARHLLAAVPSRSAS